MVGLSKPDALLLESLFVDNPTEVSLASLKNKFHGRLTAISQSLSANLDNQGLFAKKRSNKAVLVIVLAILLIVCGIPLSFFAIMIAFSLLSTSFQPFLPSLVGALMLVLELGVALPLLFFGIKMSKLTPAGEELQWNIKGFKLYMDTAEKHRAQFYEREGMLEKLLPYAIMFGMTKEWLAKMKDIYGEEYLRTHQPSFMVGAAALSGFGNFDSFTKSLNAITASISSNVSPASSGSGGRGSSGGGGGGGGGGGW
jgi:uncharacterized membrane protein